LNRSFSMTDLASDLSQIVPIGEWGLPEVSSVILMELEKVNNTFSAGLQEAQYFHQVALNCAADPISLCGGALVAGYVASAPLESGYDAVFAYITSLSESAPGCVGIRQALWTTEEIPLFTNANFWGGLTALAEAGLVFDVLVHVEELQYLAILADQLPQVRINLNHLGYPEVSNSSAFDTWATDIANLAERPNVYCKLSGLPQSTGQPGWSSQDFFPYVAAAIKAFGPKRVNFGGCLIFEYC
jgi:predicted TIM-barrel fold metal-dependent hydrolase